MTKRDLPRFCTWNTDRHGKRRVRFRKGHHSTYLYGTPYSDAFMRLYHAELEGNARRLEIFKQERVGFGTIDAVIVSFYRSTDFLKLKSSTRKERRNMLEKFRIEHGQKRVAMLTAAHVKVILGDMADRPGAANILLKALRVLLRHAIDMGLLHDNPDRNVRKLPVRSEGFHSWTDDDVEAFETVHRAGPRARLALALLLYTGQRRSDVVRMGWQHIDGNLLNVTQEKTGVSLKVPMHPRLKEAIL